MPKNGIFAKRRIKRIYGYFTIQMYSVMDWKTEMAIQFYGFYYLGI